MSSSSSSPSVLAAWLDADETLILDGALATELERRGADLNDPLWSARVLLEQPALIRAVHLDYFRAGADVATTASYQATFEGFARRGLSHDEATQCMRTAVALACEARDQFWSEWGAPAGAMHWQGRRRPLVAASIGPYGAMRADGSEYRGYPEMTRHALRDFHRERLSALAATPADLLACETLPCLEEALALADLVEDWRAAHPERTGWGAWMSFSCRDGTQTCQGDLLADAAAALDGYAGVLAIGVNCTPPQYVAELLASVRGHTRKPLLTYPNAGETYDPVAKRWQPHTAGALLTLASACGSWRQAGASLMGGCCRTTPEDIAALRQRLATPGA